MANALQQLKAYQKKVIRLSEVSAILDWDQLTYMPAGAAADRADQQTTLQMLIHNLAVDPEVGRLLEASAAEVVGQPEGSEDAALVRVSKRDYDRSTRVPSNLIEELVSHSSMAYEVWVKARKQSDFSIFAPVLRKTVELNKRLADCLGYDEHPYDALLSQHEPGMTASKLRQLFAELRPALVKLVAEIAAAPQVDSSFLRGDFAVDRQQELTLEAVGILGYDTNRGRQDKTVHPFCTSFSCNDVRITTRYDEHMLGGALYASLHEAGHAMYEQGLPGHLELTALCRAASSGVHESQSRLWENMVGRSRQFCAYFLPRLVHYFPETFNNISAEELYRAVNRVEPSLIRVEADEVTYNLHIILRFELEIAMLEGRLDIDDLPDAWDAAMHEMLGVIPPSDTEGCLQDVHWSSGFGGFPAYTLGNLIAAQLWNSIRHDLPNLGSAIESGNCAPLLTWLRDHVHSLGARLDPMDLVQHSTGEVLDSKYLISYLHEKYRDIYGL